CIAGSTIDDVQGQRAEIAADRIFRQDQIASAIEACSRINVGRGQCIVDGGQVVCRGCLVESNVGCGIGAVSDGKGDGSARQITVQYSRAGIDRGATRSGASRRIGERSCSGAHCSGGAAAGGGGAERHSGGFGSGGGYCCCGCTLSTRTQCGGAEVANRHADGFIGTGTDLNRFGEIAVEQHFAAETGGGGDTIEFVLQ